MTTNLVLKEFRDLRSRNLAENALKNSVLQIADPNPLFLRKAAAIAGSLEHRGVSDADASIFGLALELKEKAEKFTLITDDHALQRLCREAGIAFEPVIRGKARPRKAKKQAKNPD